MLTLFMPVLIWEISELTYSSVYIEEFRETQTLKSNGLGKTNSCAKKLLSNYY